MHTLTEGIWINVKSAYLRITYSKYTIAFFLFGFTHCWAQGMIQSFLFSMDSDASTLVSNILQVAGVPPREIPYLTHHGNDLTLKACNDIHGITPDLCTTIFQTGKTNISLQANYKRSELISQSIQPISDSSNTTGVQLSVDGNDVLLNSLCTRVLLYPDQILSNFKREDIALICLQFWLYFISFIAVVFNSVPHTLAVLCARVLTTGWSAFSIWRLQTIKFRFHQLVVDANSPCHTTDLFPNYFESRRGFEIADLVLNCTALFVSAFLSLNLVKVYTAHSFKRVGPPADIIRIYRLFLSIFVCLQLSSYFLLTTSGLWIDTLFNGRIKEISEHTPVYIACFVVTAIFFVPWISMGWFAVRREMKRVMMLFLLVGLVFTAGWATMFYSMVFRWLFTQWPFFACITVLSFIVTIGSCVLGIICWRNFNKGLAHYLYVEAILSSSDFEHAVFPHDVEKSDEFKSLQSVYGMQSQFAKEYRTMEL